MILTGNSEDNAVFYKLTRNKDILELAEIKRVKTDFSKEDPCQVFS